MAYLFLVAAFSLNAAGNILLKVGSLRGLTTQGPLISLLTQNWQFAVGIVVLALNALIYALALRTVPLSMAYPIMVVMSFIIINAYALTALGEQLTLVQAIGYVCIVLGLALVVAPLA
jgi:multidrug transporter EmrE-like cation transporter